MHVHVIYTDDGRIISATLEELELPSNTPRAFPVEDPTGRAATFEVADDDSPLSLPDFIATARVDVTESNPRLVFENSLGDSSETVAATVDEDRPPLRAQAPVHHSTLREDLGTPGDPLGPALRAFEALLMRTGDRSVGAARLGMAMRDVIAPLASRSYADALPEFGAAIVEAFQLPRGAARRLEFALTAGLPVVTSSQPSLAALGRAWQDALESGEIDSNDPEESFWERLITAAAADGSPERAEGRAQRVWVKVASLEREEHTPQVRRTSTGGKPLYCRTTADRYPWDKLDEPKAAELPFVGDIRTDVLHAPSDSVEDRQEVEKGWQVDLTHDLPDGYWERIRKGYSADFYHWFLVEPGLSDTDWFEQGLAEVQKTLKDKQKEVQDKVEKLVKDTVSGTPMLAPAAPLAGALARELTKHVTDYLVDVLSAKRFEAVNVMHVTAYEPPKPPLSLVLLTRGDKEVQLHTNAGTDVHPQFTQHYADPKVDTVSRGWSGASRPAGVAPRIHAAVAEADKVVTWRSFTQATATRAADSPEGFGAFVPQRQGKGKYVVLVRADVRHLPVSQLAQ